MCFERSHVPIISVTVHLKRNAIKFLLIANIVHILIIWIAFWINAIPKTVDYITRSYGVTNGILSDIDILLISTSLSGHT